MNRLFSLDEAAERSGLTRETIRGYIYRYGLVLDRDYVVRRRLTGPGGRFLRRNVYLTDAGLMRLFTQRYGTLVERVLRSRDDG